MEAICYNCRYLRETEWADARTGELVHNYHCHITCASKALTDTCKRYAYSEAKAKEEMYGR